ncbi:helix-turn-helix domain-containing protein [Sedimentisphaera salicampi]|uniref:LexA repressor n=1 Tax=Sedimentisphaera salicampi TaxID=1941349 RepID=A0A1W6LJE7_9BACT|nr:LexA family transcriptional regulator [Sedimentisphaera salicampi]ARN55864.1 LexA repressor [Sedimentisphaera salicampi]OXU16055.1 LexA repressor [Sedimentisphaera salicampi]
MVLGKIIRKRRKELQLTLDDVSEKIGYSKPYISTVETGKVRNPPGQDFLTKLEDLLGFDRGELLYLAEMKKMPILLRDQIEGSFVENERLRRILSEMLQEDNTGQVRRFLEKHHLDIKDFRKNSISGVIPVINKVSAGYPADFGDLSYPAGFADEYINCPGLNDPNAFAVRVVGDSMKPDYCEGDIVVFSPSRAVNNGDDCFVRFKDPFEATFKRVYYENDGSIRLQPRNTDFPPSKASTYRLNGVYKAVLKYQYL